MTGDGLFEIMVGDNIIGRIDTRFNGQAGGDVEVLTNP
jgi:hypothetical protein